jgi:tRNA(Ile)-lysidine synthase
MASSRKSSRSNPPVNPPLAARGGDAGGVAARVAAKIREFVRPSARVVAGLSGGVDSVVLLDCLQRAARQGRFRLSALHVNHQLSPNAARWSAFCRRLCRARGIPFESVKVDVPKRASVEAAARAARYAVFAHQPCDCIVLAHHQDDQVETLLLQLLRGAGVKGLAAMPELRKGKGKREKGISSVVSRQSPPSILRPLLDVTRGEILAYAKKHGLKWIEDESNLDTRFRRNFLRHDILPAIAHRFPSYRTTIARSAGHLAEAARLLDEVAASDAAAHMAEGALAVEGLRRLPPARARNLLRYFLAQRGIDPPGAARLGEALRQALTAKQDARVAVDVGDARIMRYAGWLHVVRVADRLPPQFSRRWRGEAKLALPEAGGMLTLVGTRGAGISVARLRSAAVTIRLRRGGERLQPDCRRPRRSLKNLLQEARVAPWLRERLPLIFCGNVPAWAAGIGVDCAFQAQPGERALTATWIPQD